MLICKDWLQGNLYIYPHLQWILLSYSYTFGLLLNQHMSILGLHPQLSVRGPAAGELD